MDKTVIVFSLKDAGVLQKTHKDIRVVTPTTPISRQMLYQFLSANYMLRQLAEGMVWGHVKPEDYAASSQQFTEATQGIEKAIKEARKKLDELHKNRKSKKKAVSQAVRAEQPKPKQAQQKPKQVVLAPAVTTPMVDAPVTETPKPETGDNGGTTQTPVSKSKPKVEVV